MYKFVPIIGCALLCGFAGLVGCGSEAELVAPALTLADPVIAYALPDTPVIKPGSLMAFESHRCTANRLRRTLTRQNWDWGDEPILPSGSGRVSNLRTSEPRRSLDSEPA